MSDFLSYGFRTQRGHVKLCRFATDTVLCGITDASCRSYFFLLITARNATDRQTAGLTVVYEGGPSNNYSYVEKGFDLAVSQLRWLQAATRCCRDGDSIALKLLIPMGAGITWCVRAAGPFRHLVRPSVPLRRCLSDVE